MVPYQSCIMTVAYWNVREVRRANFWDEIAFLRKLHKLVILYLAETKTMIPPVDVNIQKCGFHRCIFSLFASLHMLDAQLYVQCALLRPSPPISWFGVETRARSTTSHSVEFPHLPYSSHVVPWHEAS